MDSQSGMPVSTALTSPASAFSTVSSYTRRPSCQSQHQLGPSPMKVMRQSTQGVSTQGVQPESCRPGEQCSGVVSNLPTAASSAQKPRRTAQPAHVLTRLSERLSSWTRCSLPCSPWRRRLGPVAGIGSTLYRRHTGIRAKTKTRHWERVDGIESYTHHVM